MPDGMTRAIPSASLPFDLPQTTESRVIFPVLSSFYICKQPTEYGHPLPILQHLRKLAVLVVVGRSQSRMTSTMIGSDILDIGTRKARRQRGDPFFVAPPAALTLGAPGQFDLPNVPDVSQLLCCGVWYATG